MSTPQQVVITPTTEWGVAWRDRDGSAAHVVYDNQAEAADHVRALHKMGDTSARVVSRKRWSGFSDWSEVPDA